MIKIGDIVEVSGGAKHAYHPHFMGNPDNGFVAYFMGEREHNGHKYNVVSPYYDEKRLHWLEIDTPLRKV